MDVLKKLEDWLDREEKKREEGWEDLVVIGESKKTLWQKIVWQTKIYYYATIPHDWRPGHVWYRLKCFFWHRYTTVHPRTLPWHTWTDRDALLEHCLFEILCQFIEKEKPAEWFDTVNSPNKEEWKQLFAIYDWWKKEYVPYFMDKSTKTDYDKAAWMANNLTKKMKELVEIRGIMWT